MPRKNPIAPFEETPEGIKEFQKVQPYPDFEQLLEEKKKYYWSVFFANIMRYEHIQDIESWVIENAEKALRPKRASQTTISWNKTRSLVYDRDGGVCDICQDKIEYEVYHAGHIIDRVCGGTDRLENLVCMCSLCNIVFKPLHETKEEYEEWKKTHQSLSANSGID